VRVGLLQVKFRVQKCQCIIYWSHFVIKYNIDVFFNEFGAKMSLSNYRSND
jgi:hypothetical protein